MIKKHWKAALYFKCKTVFFLYNFLYPYLNLCILYGILCKTFYSHIKIGADDIDIVLIIYNNYYYSNLISHTVDFYLCE